MLQFSSAIVQEVYLVLMLCLFGDFIILVSVRWFENCEHVWWGSDYNNLLNIFFILLSMLAADKQELSLTMLVSYW